MVTEICRPYTKELRFECPIGWHESVRCRLECCDVAAAFVRRQRLAFKAVTESCGGVRTRCSVGHYAMLPCGQLG